MRLKTYVWINIVVATVCLLVWGLRGGGSPGEDRPKAIPAVAATPAAVETSTVLVTGAVASSVGISPRIGTPTPTVPATFTGDSTWWVDVYKDVAPEDYQDSGDYVPVAAFPAPCVCGEWLGTVPAPELQDAKWWIARFEADLDFPKGIFRFRVAGTGSVRFFVDNDLVFERWPSNSDFDEVVPVRFDETGQHNLVYEIAPTERGVAKAYLSWEDLARRLTQTPVATPTQALAVTPIGGGLPGEVTTVTPTDTPEPVLPTPVSDSSWVWWVDFYKNVKPSEYNDCNDFVPVAGYYAPCVCTEWVRAVPHEKLQNAATWIARFEADVRFGGGIYLFRVQGVGSVRFFVDEELLFELWPWDGPYDELVPVRFNGVGEHNLVYEVVPTREKVAKATLTWEQGPRRPSG